MTDKDVEGQCHQNLPCETEESQSPG